MRQSRRSLFLIVVFITAWSSPSSTDLWAASRRLDAPQRKATELPRQALVQRVIDGDTIELASGQLVRYIGIDTPEVRRRHGTQWIVDPEPFAREATEANTRLVKGQLITLEYDVQTHDRYGRLLAYVWVNDTMVNATLLTEGYAQLLTIPPNTKYVDDFRRQAELARHQRRGLWSR